MSNLPLSVSPDALRQQIGRIKDSIDKQESIVNTASTNAATALATATTASTAASAAQTDATAALAAIAAYTITSSGSGAPAAAPTGSVIFYTDTSGPTQYIWSASNTTWYEIAKGGSIFIP